MRRRTLLGWSATLTLAGAPALQADGTLAPQRVGQAP